jgi:hypothetical protein
VELNTADTMFLVLILYSTSPDKEKTDRWTGLQFCLSTW